MCNSIVAESFILLFYNGNNLLLPGIAENIK